MGSLEEIITDNLLELVNISSFFDGSLEQIKGSFGGDDGGTV